MGIVFSPEAIMDSRVPEPDAHVVAGGEGFEPCQKCTTLSHQSDLNHRRIQLRF